MSTKTEDALERLRMGITHFTGAVETADIRAALAEIERLTKERDEGVSTEEYEAIIAEHHAELAKERAAHDAAKAEIERLRNEAFREEVSAAWREKHCAQRAAKARAAGYEAGQREMRERVASTMDCDCPSTVTTCIFGDSCSREDASNVRELPILPEPQEGQS